MCSVVRACLVGEACKNIAHALTWAAHAPPLPSGTLPTKSGAAIGSWSSAPSVSSAQARAVDATADKSVTCAPQEGAQGGGASKDWDWEAYVDQVIAVDLDGCGKGQGTAVHFCCAYEEVMDVRTAEEYVDRVLVAPAVKTGLMEGNQMLRLQEDAHTLNTILSQMALQDDRDSSLIDSAHILKSPLRQ